MLPFSLSFYENLIKSPIAVYFSVLQLTVDLCYTAAKSKSVY